jgi:hypothetical protein
MRSTWEIESMLREARVQVVAWERILSLAGTPTFCVVAARKL